VVCDRALRSVRKAPVNGGVSLVLDLAQKAQELEAVRSSLRIRRRSTMPPHRSVPSQLPRTRRTTESSAGRTPKAPSSRELRKQAPKPPSRDSRCRPATRQSSYRRSMFPRARCFRVPSQQKPSDSQAGYSSSNCSSGSIPSSSGQGCRSHDGRRNPSRRRSARG
jgi:hypothetical protein